MEEKKKKRIKIAIHALIFICLISIIIFMIFKNDGIIDKEMKLSAQNKLSAAMQEYSEGKYSTFKEALESIVGYGGIEETETGMHIVKIDGKELFVSYPEEEKSEGE